MIEKVAKFIAERHLAPAGILLFLNLSVLYTELEVSTVFYSLPVAEIIFDSKKYQQFAIMMEDENNIKKLINRMDELDEIYTRERRQENKLKNSIAKPKERHFTTNYLRK